MKSFLTVEEPIAHELDVTTNPFEIKLSLQNLIPGHAYQLQLVPPTGDAVLIAQGVAQADGALTFNAKGTEMSYYRPNWRMQVVKASTRKIVFDRGNCYTGWQHTFLQVVEFIHRLPFSL